MNVKLLRKVAKHILAEPKRFVMRVFVVTKAEEGGAACYLNDDYEEQRFAKCGTAACIGGWTCILAGDDLRKYSQIEVRARKHLGLKPKQSERLFYVTSWPFKFRNLFDMAKTPRARVRIAAQRIEHFIKTGE